MSNMTQSVTDGPRLYVPAMAGFYRSCSGLGVPLIRFAAGVILMPHGMQKLFGAFGGSTSGAIGFFYHIGLHPAVGITYLVGLTEFVGGLCLALGLFTRVAAAAIFIELTVAWAYVDLANGYFWTSGGAEYPLLWSLVALGFFLNGGGRLSLDRAIGREF